MQISKNKKNNKQVVIATLTKEAHDDVILSMTVDPDAERDKILQFTTNQSKFISGIYNGSKVYVAQTDAINAKLPLKYSKCGYLDVQDELTTAAEKLRTMESRIQKYFSKYYGAVADVMLKSYVVNAYHIGLEIEIAKQQKKEAEKQAAKKRKLQDLIDESTEQRTNLKARMKKGRKRRLTKLKYVDDEAEEVPEDITESDDALEDEDKIQKKLPNPTNLLNQQVSEAEDKLNNLSLKNTSTSTPMTTTKTDTNTDTK